MLWHIGIALAIQLAVTKGLRTSWWAGAAAATAWALSREITQAEYRWIEHLGSDRRANMPWWAALDRRVWHSDAMLDWLIPSMAVLTTARLASSSPVRRPSS